MLSEIIYKCVLGEYGDVVLIVCETITTIIHIVLTLVHRSRGTRSNTFIGRIDDNNVDRSLNIGTKIIMAKRRMMTAITELAAFATTRPRRNTRRRLTDNTKHDRKYV